MQMPDDAYQALDKKLDKVVTEQSSTRVEMAGVHAEVKRIADLDTRLRAVEKFQWQLAGAVLVISIVVPIIVSIVVKYIMGA